ncbi:hypothetical protein HDU98_002849, partial [Podochytrium sp. JEL0797]
MSTSNTTTAPHPMFPPGYIPNFAKLASWSSPTTAFLFLATTLLLSLLILRNLLFRAKSLQTRTVYVYLLLWGLFRIVAFAMRGHVLLGDNGQNEAAYQWAQVAASVGFMPLAKVLTLNVLEGTTFAYSLHTRTRHRLKILVSVSFILFVACVCGYVFDFTLNKPFGSKVADYPADLVLRELGFNGLLAITVYSLIGAVRNAVKLLKVGKMDPEVHGLDLEFVRRVNLVMYLVAGQAGLMIVKLSYITYRNWNPDEFRDEKYWYLVSITPEILYVLCFCPARVLSVFDEMDAKREKAIVLEAKKDELTRLMQIANHLSSSASSKTLFGPSAKNGWGDLNTWLSVTDRVRGSISTAVMDLSHADRAVFNGVFDTSALGGAGFASVRANLNGHTYALNLYNELGGWREDGRRESSIEFKFNFKTRGSGGAHGVEVFEAAFDEFVPYYRGRPVDNGERIDASRIVGLSLMVQSYFDQQKGPYEAV